LSSVFKNLETFQIFHITQKNKNTRPDQTKPNQTKPNPKKANESWGCMGISFAGKSNTRASQVQSCGTQGMNMNIHP
jgi:hypothetical protein